MLTTRSSKFQAVARVHGQVHKTYAIERARASGASEHELQETARQMQSFKKLYDQPLFNAAVTFLEPFPIGLVVTLISAAVLRKRSPPR